MAITFEKLVPHHRNSAPQRNQFNYAFIFLFFYHLYAFARITMKELKSFLSRVNCKIATAILLEQFNEVDVRQRGELRFDDFLRLYQKLLVANTV